MKILKKGKIPIKINFIVTCWNCNSELEYEKSEIKSNVRNESYVECPICDSFITHTQS